MTCSTSYCLETAYGMNECISWDHNLHTHMNLKGHFTNQHNCLPILSLNSHCTTPYNIKIKCKIINIQTQISDVWYAEFCWHPCFEWVHHYTSFTVPLDSSCSPAKCWTSLSWQIPTAVVLISISCLPGKQCSSRILTVLRCSGTVYASACVLWQRSLSHSYDLKMACKILKHNSLNLHTLKFLFVLKKVSTLHTSSCCSDDEKL
jgi:hypothetical protein